MYGEEIEILKIIYGNALFSLKCILSEINSYYLEAQFIFNFLENSDFYEDILDNSIKFENVCCNLKVDDLYRFYIEFEKCYNELNGNCILKNNTKDIFLEVNFLKLGKIKVKGFIKNQESIVSSGILFDFDIEHTYLMNWLENMKYFFRVLEENHKRIRLR